MTDRLLCFSSGLLKRLALGLIFWTLYVSAVAAAEELRVVLIPLESPTGMYKRFLPLKRFLQQELSMKVSLTVAKDIRDILKQLQQKEADVVFLCPTLYCRAAMRGLVVPLVKLSVKGRAWYRSAIVVREDSDITRTIDLFQRSFVFGRYQCPGSGLLPVVMLERVGIEEADFFEVLRLGSDRSAVLAVLARMFDATAVPESVAHKYTDKGLRILRYSYPIPQYLFAARRDLARELLLRLKRVMLSVNQSSDRERILKSISEEVDGFRDVSDSEYDIVRALLGMELPSPEDALTIVVEPVLAEVEVFYRMGSLVEFLRKGLNRRVRVIVPDSEDDFVEMMKSVRDALFLYSDIFTPPGPTMTPVARVWLFGKDSEYLIIKGQAEGVKTAVASSYHRLAGVNIEFPEVVGTYENVVLQVYRGHVPEGLVNSSVLASFSDDLHLKKLQILKRVKGATYWRLVAGTAMNFKEIDNLKRLLKSFKGPPLIEPLP